ncbi:transmembrane protein 81 [Melanotaenia boesemani]|uniref:transmembrane protein 81 n=1 Tax=Melanotaenia boesemani TaxID=1250792 RepID=UPI001C04A6B8|nr:transmembrane protein 81 [Melanotaenia boesemani]
MLQGSVRLSFFLLLCTHFLTSADLEEVDEVPVEVITDSSPCSATCGLGLKTQTLCLLKDSQKALEDKVNGKDGTQEISQSNVSDECRVRKVKCLEMWQCGLRTMTVASGQKVEIDCLEEVMEAMGRFSWRVSWRYAPGMITSDDSLFERWEAPHLDRVILDPVREEDAGTYRCDVQDTNYRRVKRVYWGIRVLPTGVINLDYESSLAQWDQTESQQKPAVLETGTLLFYAVGISVILAGGWTGLLGLYRRKMRT